MNYRGCELCNDIFDLDSNTRYHKQCCGCKIYMCSVCYMFDGHGMFYPETGTCIYCIIMPTKRKRKRV